MVFYIILRISHTGISTRVEDRNVCVLTALSPLPFCTAKTYYLFYFLTRLFGLQFWIGLALACVPVKNISDKESCSLFSWTRVVLFPANKFWYQEWGHICLVVI